MLVLVRGAGDLASACALRLKKAHAQVIMLECEKPLAVRRSVSFSEAIRLGSCEVEGQRAQKANSVTEALEISKGTDIAVLIDPEGKSIPEIAPDVVLDGILAKKNLGTHKKMAKIVLALGPGFHAGPRESDDCHAVIETKRGHYLGRVIYDGIAIPNTGIPGLIGGYGKERVLRAPSDGVFLPLKKIGDSVSKGEVIATVSGKEMRAEINGILRGLLPEGYFVEEGLKAGDIDPRAKTGHVKTISDKARAVAGGVLEAVLSLSAGLSDCKGGHLD